MQHELPAPTPGRLDNVHKTDYHTGESFIMNRRELLGLGAGATLMGLGGCVDTVANATTRTGSGPAVTYVPTIGAEGGDSAYLVDIAVDDYVVSPETTSITNAPLTIEGSVAGISGSVDIDGWFTASQYRSSGSPPGGHIDPETVDDINAATSKDSDDDGYRPEKAVAYLEGDAVIGERFLLSLPNADPPGSSEPMATFSPSQLLDAVTDDDTDGDGGGSGDSTVTFKPGQNLAENVKLSGVSTPVQNVAGGKEYDKASPKIYSGLDTDGDGGAQGLPAEWPGEYSVKGGTVSNSILAGAVVSVKDEDGSRTDLPALLHMKHIRHGNDYLFDGGWMVDAGHIYRDAATVLVQGGSNELVGLSSAELDAADDATVRDQLTSDRSRLGGHVYTGPATADIQQFLPEELRDGVGLGRFASISKRSARKGRNPQTGKEIKIPAKRITTMSHMVGLARAAEGRWDCGSDSAGTCRTVQSHADNRFSLLERAETYRAAGEDRLAYEVLQEVRAIVQADIDLLSNAEDQQAVGDLLGLERALRREIDLTLDPVTGESGEGDDFPMAFEVAVAPRTGDIPGDDDGDGIWDGIEASAVAGEVSSEELRIQGEGVGIGHTFELKEGRKGMNAVNVQRTSRADDGDNTLSSLPDSLYWDTSDGDSGEYTVTLTVVTDAEGQLMNKAELIDAIASEADITKADAKKARDAFIDTTTKALARNEKDDVKREKVVTEPAAGGEKESGEEYFVHATGLIDEIRDDDEVTFEMLKPIIVPLDAPLVHLTTSTTSLTKRERNTLVKFGSTTEVEAEATVSIASASTDLEKAGGQEIHGTSSYPAGVELTVNVRASEPQPLLRTKTVTTDADGNWSATFDLSEATPDQEATIEVTADGQGTAHTTATIGRAPSK